MPNLISNLLKKLFDRWYKAEERGYKVLNEKEARASALSHLFIANLVMWCSCCILDELSKGVITQFYIDLFVFFGIWVVALLLLICCKLDCMQSPYIKSIYDLDDLTTGLYYLFGEFYTYSRHYNRYTESLYQVFKNNLSDLAESFVALFIHNGGIAIQYHILLVVLYFIFKLIIKIYNSIIRFFKG